MACFSGLADAERAKRDVSGVRGAQEMEPVLEGGGDLGRVSQVEGLSLLVVQRLPVPNQQNAVSS